MGRNPKQGLDYFPADVDMFQDRKIKRLLRAVGGKGFTIFIYLLTSIYRDKGYYYEWDNHSAFDISDDLNLAEKVVEETVKACCSIGLFHEVLYTEESILTSESIQNRWQKIVTDANRVETSIEPNLKIEDGKISNRIKKSGFSSQETHIKSEETPQSKVKDSKVEESRVNTAHTREQIENIYQSYPRKVGKDKALKKIQKALREIDYDELLARVQLYAKCQEGNDPQFIPHPTTWFNQGRWKDDPSEWETWKKFKTRKNENKGDKRAKILNETYESWPE